MTVYKHEGRTVWAYSFLWIDDCAWNRGYKELQGSFIGTQKDFYEMWETEQNGQGFNCWKIKKRHATKAEFDEFLRWL